MASPAPTLDRAELLARWYRKDPVDNGRFLVGVLTTGIYCLPTCPARKPKDENVRFFAGEDDARGAGLRPCKRCRPDHFYRHFDPEQELAARLAAAIRTEPARFEGVGALRAEAGVGATKLNALFRRHFHTTPAAFLQRARLERAAGELVRTDRRVLDVALDAGFESSSAFHEGFRAQYALAPGAYRRLARGGAFALTLPPGYRSQEAFGILDRDPEGASERVDGRRASKALLLAGRPARLDITLERGSARVEVSTRSGRPSARTMVAAHAAAYRLLGLGCDPAPFERRVKRVPGMARIVRRRTGLRIPCTTSIYEGLVWVVVGQQVNLAFASMCRARLIALAGTPVGDMVAHPSPEAVAALEPTDLLPLQFSRRKAEYLIDLSRALATGELDLDALAHAPVPEARERLTAIRGLGPWSVHYLLMRSFGLADCVPVGDVALEAALERFYELDGRPDARQTLALMEPFAPHRSLATFHLWKSLGDPA